MKRYMIFSALLASVALAACKEQSSALVGKWAGGPENLEFTKDGGLTVRKGSDEQQWTWEQLGQDIVVKREGKEFYCGINSRLKNQLALLKRNSIGEANCPFPGLYWDVDPPAERPAPYVAFKCKPSPESFSRLLKYTGEYVVEADKESGVACFGRTANSCDYVDGANVSDDWVESTVRFSGGAAERYEIEARSQDGLRFTQSETSSCSDGGCLFGGYVVVGACEKLY